MKILRTFEGYGGASIIEGDGEGCGGGELWEDMEVNMVDGSVCVCVEQYRGKRYRHGGGGWGSPDVPSMCHSPLGLSWAKFE